MKAVKRITAALMVAAMSLTALAGNAGAAEPETEKTAVVSVEAFTIGNGYVIEPTEVSISDGETVASVVERVLNAKGISYESTGTVENNFYLKNVTFRNSNKIPSYITDAVVAVDEETGENICFGDYIEEGGGNTLGANDYCAYLAGWMFTVNSPTKEDMSLGMSQKTVNNGDVIRVQFSLDCGADIGTATLSGMPEWGYHADFYPVADKTELTRTIAQSDVSKPSPQYNALEKLKKTAQYLPATEEQINSSLSDYNYLVANATITGDVDKNGILSIADAIVIQKQIAKITELDSVSLLISDVDSDDNISVSDAILLQKKLAKIIA